MLGIVSAGALSALLAAAPQAAPLVRASRPMVASQVMEEGKGFSHEQGIAPSEALAVIQQVRERIGPAHTILRVPGRPGSFLVVGTGRPPTSSTDPGGLRLMLVERSGGGVSLLAQSGGSGDSYVLRPVAFTGGGRTIVLAEMATEYSWGLRVFEVTARELRDLGSIDAGVPGEMGEEDPTPFARVTIERGQVVVTFDHDLVIGTGNEDAPVARKPVVFRQGGRGFALDRPRFRTPAPRER